MVELKSLPTRSRQLQLSFVEDSQCFDVLVLLAQILFVFQHFSQLIVGRSQSESEHLLLRAQISRQSAAVCINSLSLALGDHHEILLDYFLLLPYVMFVAIFAAELFDSLLLAFGFLFVRNLFLCVSSHDSSLDEDLT